MSKKKDKEIEIVMGDEVFPAELLWKEAPKTCEAVYNAMVTYSDIEYISKEYREDVPVLDVLSVPPKEMKALGSTVRHTGYAGFCMLCMSFTRTQAPWKIPPENQKFVLEAGDCTWKTYEGPPHKPMFHQEMYIAYKPTSVLGYRGVNLCNHFLKITDKLDELAAIGDEVWSKGTTKYMMIRKKE